MKLYELVKEGELYAVYENGIRVKNAIFTGIEDFRGFNKMTQKQVNLNKKQKCVICHKKPAKTNCNACKSCLEDLPL